MTQTNEFRGGLPGSPVAGALTLCGEAEEAGLSKSGSRVASIGLSCLPNVCREGVEETLHNGASWMMDKREQV